MAYTPINWQNGDTITAAKLNKMDNGWGVESTPLFSETVTTVAGDDENSATLAYTGTASPDAMRITFDGVDYNCAKQKSGSRYWYGASSPTDWTAYPFLLGRFGGEWLLYTQVAGTYTISASASSLQTSDDFKAAVFSIAPQPMLCVPEQTTYDEMNAAADAGRLLYLYGSRTCRFISNFFEEVSETAVTVFPTPSASAESYGFEDQDGTLVLQRYVY